MSRLLALSGETVIVKSRDGKETLFTVTAFDPLAGKYIGVGHHVSAKIVGRLPKPVKTVHLENRDELSPLSGWDVEPHALLGPIECQNYMGVRGCLKRTPRQGLMWTAPARVGQAYIISNGLSDLSSRSVDGLPVAIPIEITGVSYELRSCVATKFSFKGRSHYKGMSGSPIIQDGYLVGALWGYETADKTVGIAVHIDQMLEGLYREANSKMKVSDHIHKCGSGKRRIRATQQQAKKAIRKANTLAAHTCRLDKNLLYIDRLRADEPKFQALRTQLAAYEAGKISKGILFEKQKRTYPEALKLLWDYDLARWKAALKTWETAQVLTREQRTAIERCGSFDV